MTDQVQKSNRKRKVRALLAGGLVLGVGAAVTLAAWSDNVFGNSDFATGNAAWNIQGNFSLTQDAGQWVESDVSPGTTFGFPVPLKLNLTPGTTVYAPVALRLAPGQTLGGTVTLAGATGGTPAGVPLVNALQYSVTSGGTAANCVAGTPGPTAVVPPGSTLATGSATGAVTLLADATPVALCFAVTLPPTATNAVSGLNTGTLIWNFSGQSTA